MTIRPGALQTAQAAAYLDMSVDSFERYVRDDVQVIRRGSMRLYPVKELDRWIAANAEPSPNETVRGSR